MFYEPVVVKYDESGEAEYSERWFFALATFTRLHKKGKLGNKHRNFSSLSEDSSPEALNRNFLNRVAQIFANDKGGCHRQRFTSAK